MHPSSGQLWNFLSEFFQRLFAKSPKFFQVIQWISLAALLVSGLPGLFQDLNIVLPDWAVTLQNRIVAIGALITLIMSKLPTQSTPVAVTQQGELIKKTDDQKLPFTAKAEEKVIVKEDLPTAESIK